MNYDSIWQKCDHFQLLRTVNSHSPKRPVIIYLQGGRQKGRRAVMKKIEIDRRGSLLFWLIKQGGHDFV